MLDEEARLPNASDANYVQKLHAAFASQPQLYSKPGLGAAAIGRDLGPELGALQFVVTHYADTVQYTAHRWLEKNRGALPADVSAVLAASDAPLLAEAFAAAASGRVRLDAVALSSEAGPLRLTLRQAADPAPPPDAAPASLPTHPGDGASGGGSVAHARNRCPHSRMPLQGLDA